MDIECARSCSKGRRRRRPAEHAQGFFDVLVFTKNQAKRNDNNGYKNHRISS